MAKMLTGLEKQSAIHWQNNAGFIGHGHEFPGWDEAVTLLPADKRFETHNPAPRQGHNGLVMVEEFAPLQGLAQVGFQLQALDGVGMHGGVEDLATGLTGALRAIHGDIGVTQQFLSAVVGSSAERNAHAGGDHNLLAVDGERGGEPGCDAFGNANGVAGVANIVKENSEFVAPEAGEGIIVCGGLSLQTGRRAGNGVVAPQRCGQALPDLNEKLVSSGVTQTVVIKLEFIHINKEHGKFIAGMTLSQVDHVLQAVEEESAIGQVGQAVVKGVVHEHLLSPFSLGDIAVNNDQFFGVAVGIADGAGGGFQDAPGAVLMSNTVFQGLAAAGKAGFLGGFDYARAVVGMNLFQGRGLLQLFGGIAKNLLIRGAVIKAPPVAINQGDHIGGILANQAKKLVMLGQLPPDAVQLQVLIDSVDVKQKHEGSQTPHPFLQISPIIRANRDMEPGKSKRNNREGEQEGNTYSKAPQPPFPALDLP